MLELRKRHMDGCAKWQEGYPYSKDLKCKKCPYIAFGRLGRKKIRQSLDTADFQEASELLLKMNAESKAPTKYTVAEARDRFEADRLASGHKKKSVDRYVYDLNQLAAFLSVRGVTQLRAVDVDDLSGWKETWTEGAKDEKQQRLRTFFRWCLERSYVEKDPTRGLTKIKADAGYKRQRLTDEQIEKVFMAVQEVYSGENNPRRDDTRICEKVTAFLLVLRYTALRIGDVTNLQKSHLNGDRLFLRTTKTGQAVFTVVPQCLLDALKGIEGPGEFYFYPGNDGTLETWKKKWSMILLPVYEKAGVTLRSHAWRDTLVFKLLHGGVSIELIARLLGHASTAITWKYYSAWVPELQEQLETAVRRAIHTA